MQRVLRLKDHDIVEPLTLEKARCIPPLAHNEAAAIASVELERFLTLVESLESGDWEKSTACPLWNVRQVVAHVTGATSGYNPWMEALVPHGQCQN
jgi:hypothetical protein